MGDLIRRCDVLDNINKRIYYFDKASFDEAVKAVCNAPSVDATPRWIPVEERLPENNFDVAIIIKHEGCTYLRVGWYRASGQFWLQAGLGLIEGTVTHWMPLPESPEEE